MANETPKPPAAPTVADLMVLMEKLNESNNKLIAAFGDKVEKALREGPVMAAMAREQMDPSMAKARELRQSLGGECPKCRMPMRVCGGPEMKDEPVLDDKGQPVTKDGKPVTRKVEATKSDAEDANHVKMVVMPNDPNAARWFQFIGLNGVKFASRRRGRAILVPRKNDFAYMLNTFSNFENDFRQSRKVRFNQGARWSPSPIHFAGKGSPMSGGRGVRYVS
jgi:hypothetical protein